MEHLRGHAGFTLVHHDVSRSVDIPVEGPIDAVMHLASPASPKDYLALPLETLAVGSTGTRNLLELAAGHDARFFMASTSEVYGDPLVHPQVESYWGHVNPIGERSVYDEAKRFSEALTAAYRRAHGLDTRIVRIFNTYGPRMQVDDGRVVSNFIVQALRNEPLTIYGDGSQTRSFCYVSDEIRGFLALLDSDEPGPVNIGNPVEMHHARARRCGDRAHRIHRSHGAPSVACRRSDAATTGHHPGSRTARVGAGRGAARRDSQLTIPHFAAALDIAR